MSSSYDHTTPEGQEREAAAARLFSAAIARPTITAEHLFTAACLWEAALDAINAQAVPVGSFAEALQAYRSKHGTAQLRDDVARLAPACDAAWNALPPDRRDDLCFDWDFCPAWLEGNFFAPKRRYRGGA